MSRAKSFAAQLAAAAFLALASVPSAAEGTAKGTELAGSVEASLAGTAGAGGAAAVSYGFEEYANLRLKSAIGERGSLYAAVNLIAASGDFLPTASGLAATSYVAGENYAAALELERLYFRIEGKLADTEVGLMRLAFGYGQAWRPSDFLCPPNPLLPDARPRGTLGIASTLYPSETSRIKAFIVSGTDPFASDGEGAFLGASWDMHGERASLQALYAFETPSDDTTWGIHRAGLSLKLEAEAAFVFDILYTCEGQSFAGPEGLKASAGVDYSLLDGDLYVLGEYLYNGSGSLDPDDDLGVLYADADWYDKAPEDRALADSSSFGEFNRRNYLYAAFVYRFDDYTNATLSFVACLDDRSGSPSLAIEHEPFQGMTLSLTCRTYVDARSFSRSGEYGELGPTNVGTAASIEAKAKLKF
jgi:hypothetical protein